jgi:hypothetical protein
MITGRVYAIQVGESGPIKFGFTTDLRSRFFALQSGHPEKLKLLADAPGSVEHERAILRACVEHRLSGEWFSPHPAVLAAVSAIRVYAFGHGEGGTDETKDSAAYIVSECEREDDHVSRVLSDTLLDRLTS